MSDLIEKIKNKAGMYSEESPDGGHNYIFFTQIADEIEQLEKDKALLLEALKNLTEMYVDMINSSDCGNWNPEEESQVVEARKAIKQCGGEV